MLIAEKILEKDFQGKTTKEEYLNCCKWLSTNVIAVNNSKHITYRTEKVETDDWSRIVRLTLYVTADEEEICERNCNICKEVTGSFFMCKVPPYRKRLKDKLHLIKEGLKGKIL